MGNTDSFPVVSQVKSGFQAACGDTEGALDTQKNFINTCPVVSQGKSFYHWYNDDNEAARETQTRFLHNLSNLADGIPVVGHAKGAVHYYMEDKEGGDSAMKSASRTVGVIGGGVMGGLIGGPVGAVAGGIAGGATLDGITTVADSKVNGGHRPSGVVAAVENAIGGDLTSGEAFDLAAGVVFDGMTGYTAGNLANKIRTAPETEIQQAVKTGKRKKASRPRGGGSPRKPPTKGPQRNALSLDHAVIEKLEMPKKVPQRLLKQDAIDQQGFRVVQKVLAAEGQGLANLLNTKRLGANPNGQINVGIKGPMVI